jgi:hypothetical protein
MVPCIIAATTAGAIQVRELPSQSRSIYLRRKNRSALDHLDELTRCLARERRCTMVRCRAPVTRATSGLLRRDTDFHALSAVRLKTANTAWKRAP